MGVPVCVEVGRQLCGVRYPSTFTWVLGVELGSAGLPSQRFTEHFCWPFLSLNFRLTCESVPGLCTLAHLPLMSGGPDDVFALFWVSIRLVPLMHAISSQTNQTNQMFCNLTSRALENTEAFQNVLMSPSTSFPLCFNTTFPLSCHQEQ